VATALLVAACSGSSGDASTSTPASSSLPTTTTPFTLSTITVFPTTTTTTAAPEPGSLEANRLLWESQGMERYRMTVTVCGQAGCYSYEVWVDGERVVEVPSDTDYPYRMGFGDVGWLFDVVESIPEEYRRRIEYDPRLGYPTEIGFDAPFSIDEEWSLAVEDLQATHEPLPEYEYPAEPNYGVQLGREVRETAALVEATVIRRESFIPVSREYWDDGWIVDVDINTIWYQRPGAPPLSTGAAQVIDPVSWGHHPHALLHQEGQRVILFLRYSRPLPDGSTAWYASWALQRTDQGLDFLGFRAERYGFDVDLPQLCTRGPSGKERNAEAELALLVHWAGEFDRLGPDEPARLALRRACAADDPAGGE